MQSTTQNIRLDWRPVVRSVLSGFLKAGFNVHAVDDHGDYAELIKFDGKLTNRAVTFAAAEAICAVDESHVILHRKGGAERVTLFIVLGNEPHETVADWSMPAISTEEFRAEVDGIIGAFSDKWEGRRCPMLLG